MAAKGSATRIEGEAGGGEYVLPDPLTAGGGKLPLEGVREVNLAVLLGEIFGVELGGADELLLERVDQGCREDGVAVLPAFAVADEELPAGEIEVFDAEADAFHQPQTGAVEEAGHELVLTGHRREDEDGLFVGEDGREAAGFASADGVDRQVEVDLQDIPVQEEQGAQSLVLSGGSNVLLDCEVSEEGFDVAGRKDFRMPFLVEEDKAPDPGDVGLFGAEGIILKADCHADLLEEARRVRMRCGHRRNRAL